MTSRTKAAIITWRNKGHTINVISKVFGRSTSLIHATLKKALEYKILRRFDNRKTPRKIKLLLCRRRLFEGYAWMKLWLPWILSDEGPIP